VQLARTAHILTGKEPADGILSGKSGFPTTTPYPRRPMPDPLVSIVIPCYKTSRYVAPAIESCLAQTWKNIEVVVVDDRSPENDAEIADRFAASDARVRVIRHERNQGVSGAFNTGFGAAAGEYMTRLAGDDVLREDAVAMILGEFARNPSADIVYCDMQLIDADGQYLQPMPTQEPENALLPAFRMGLCVMWKRAVWEGNGPFRPRYDTAEDYEFYLRATRNGFRLSKCHDGAPMFFRYHADQQGARSNRRQDVAMLDAQLSHLKALFARSPWRLDLALRIARNSARLAVRRAKFRYHGVGAFRDGSKGV
jgi:glycosyltransferase involved in cell wall biosynthesis